VNSVRSKRVSVKTRILQLAEEISRERWALSWDNEGQSRPCRTKIHRKRAL